MPTSRRRERESDTGRVGTHLWWANEGRQQAYFTMPSKSIGIEDGWVRRGRHHPSFQFPQGIMKKRPPNNEGAP